MKVNKLKIFVLLLLFFILYIYKIFLLTKNKDTFENNINTDIATPTPSIAEDSGKCGINADVIDYCLNYTSCCSKKTYGNKCLCSIPFIQNCRNNFEACLNNNSDNLSKQDQMNKCRDLNKSCCLMYQNISIDMFNTTDNNIEHQVNFI